MYKLRRKDKQKKYYKNNDFIITSENIDKDTAEIEYTMTWNK